MSEVAAIALGSNLTSAAGDREATLNAAVQRLRSLGEVLRVSSWYDTAPVGYTDQPRFLNGALLLRTELEPAALMRQLLQLEREMGRTRTGIVPKGPRVLDLDLLLYGSRVLSSAELVLPHPAMAERLFVLEPLAEIAPKMLHPVLRRTVADLLQRLQHAP
ncbi:MAG: 2-amino-4-hydroxy-6-hydroxymethyldihydropteridine diphosphokinase [Acidobacteriota bacterium]|nr:2-amino-4-hydroxy-6-hydroxymethyldihydropteridine diphosphokinase [Acidobacteriota bacterium]